jgi:hypothetical protein
MGFDHPEQHSTQQHSADSFPYTNPKHMVYFTEYVTVSFKLIDLSY